ncbi:MAG: 30S ribosomal protein S4 [Parcubacteria group bacterium]
MKIGPKYKLARRLGAPVFEKTQTQKFTLSLARKEKSSKKRRPRPRSEYGTQLIEKQKARFSYYLTEKQFSNYVKKALSSSEPAQKLFRTLESRLDNVLFRSGMAKTRMSARQMASHGHIMVNGRRVTIPSILLKEGDKVGIRPGSAESALFRDSGERIKSQDAPAWLVVDAEKSEVEVKGVPVYEPGEHVFDLGVVLEFYSR